MAPEGPAQARPWAKGRHGTSAVVAVCTLASGIGCSLAFMVGYLGPELLESPGLSRGELGLLISVFFGGTGLGSLVMGRIAAAWGAQLLVAADLAVVTLSFLLIGIIGSYPVMLAAAAMSGAGYAMVNIGSNLAISRGSTRDRIGLNLSIKTAGVPIMATGMAVLAPPVADRFSYQTVSFAMGIFALVSMVCAFWVLPTVQREVERPSPEGTLPAGFYWLPVSAFLLIAGSQPLLSWIVTYAHDVGHYSAATAGMASAVGTGVGAVFMLVVAARSDLAGPGSRAAFVAMACVMCAAGTALVWLAAAHSIVLLAAGAIIGISGNLVAAGMTHTLVVDRAPGAIGRGTGLTMTGYFAGALVSPFLFGLVADGPGGYSAAWAGCTGTIVLAAVGYWCLQKRGLGISLASS